MPVVRTATTKTPSKSASRRSTARRITDIGGSTLMSEMYACAVGCLHRFLNTILRLGKLADPDERFDVLVEGQPVHRGGALTFYAVYQRAICDEMLQQLPFSVGIEERRIQLPFHPHDPRG